MRSHPPQTALNDANTLAELLAPRDWLAAATRAFRAYGAGGVAQPAPLSLPLPRGGLHVKVATSPDRGATVAIKLNANLPDNPARHGLPTIQGVVVAIDARRGTVRALIDSAALTAWRTAAATTVALRSLIADTAPVVALIGCGVQGAAHAALIASTLRPRELRLYDVDPGSARTLARAVMEDHGVRASLAATLRTATAGASAIVCCTSARRPYLRRALIEPGATVAAVGADHPRKRELCDDLLAVATLVVDSRVQALSMGEWHHASGAARRPAELGEILRGERRGRRSSREIVVFDSTGFGLQDACAVDTLLARLRGKLVPRFHFAAAHAGRQR